VQAAQPGNSTFSSCIGHEVQNFCTNP